MTKDRIWRRLFPLYLSRFGQGLILWYAIEKVFMTDIGFDASGIALVVMLGSFIGLILEIPSGILADRWSRRGVLMVSYVSLALVSLLFGLSGSVLEYTLASILFAVHLALVSGVNDAIVYDTMLEETGKRDGFERYYSYSKMFTSAGLVVSSLLGGVVGATFGLEAAYFLSIPGGLLAVASLFFLREPQLHKQSGDQQLIKHTVETLRHVFRRDWPALVAVTILSLGLINLILAYVDQLWPLALDLQLVWYGPLNALLLLGYGVGAALGSRILGNRALLILTCVSVVVFTCLLTVANMPVIALAQFGCNVMLGALLIVAYGKLHDCLPSYLRSGSSSAIGTLLTLTYMPLVYAFGVLTEKESVFIAATMFIPLALIGVAGMLQLQAKQTG